MSEKFEKFQKLLKEMFELDKSDLDFGIYRIINIRKDKINKFLEEDLKAKVIKTLGEASATGGVDAHKRIKEIEDEAKSLGLEPTAIPKYKDEYTMLQAQLNTGTDIDTLENDVYSALYNFFNRYYDQGDFISKRRYKEGVYAIPYEGEEVKLYWANHDQYYIKSGENFKDYSFTLSSGKTVHFKLVDATTETANNKESTGKERCFMPAESVEFAELSVECDSLTFNFVFDFPTDKSKKQANFDTENKAKMLKFINENPTWAELLQDCSTDKRKRTFVEKHYETYVAKNSFDYFIHKDLKKFLTQELDFFIKSEIMHLDDIDTDNEASLSSYLAKVKAIKRIGKDIIDFLAQIEDFQKKLWLKKKFIVETNWCITLDKIDSKFYDEIANNTEQIQEWIEMYAIDDITGDLATVGFTNPPTKEFLEENKYLLVDTKHFSTQFKDKLVSTIDNIDEQTNGLMIHSENFQALNLLQEKYKEQVKCIYIDPPYNTGSDDNFVYKDSFEHSTWLSMIHDRIFLSKNLMAIEAPLFSSIDEDEWHNLRILLEQIFGETNYVNEIVWQKLTGAKKQSKYFSNLYEKIIVFRKTDSLILNKIYIDSKKDEKNYPYIEEGSNRRYGSFDFTQAGTGEAKYFGKELLTPPLGKHWIWSQEKIDDGVKNNLIIFTKNGIPRVKRYLDEKEGNAVGDFWIDDEISPLSANDSERIGFNTQKPLCLINRIINASVKIIKSSLNSTLNTPNAPLILDYFAGSGTTGHAVINLNREDNGNRKYILVEMGEYFNTVTKPRIKKVIYSDAWKDGKPVNRTNGVSHIMKYVKLESYEDTLQNIQLDNEKNTLFGDKLGNEYLLNYMLNIESEDSLLNVEKFINPFNYALKITEKNESKETNIDLCETFNYLIGLNVVSQSEVVRYSETADAPCDYDGAVGIKKDANGTHSFKMYEGVLRTGEKTLVIWRTLTSDTQKDNAMLDAYFAKKEYNPKDSEYDIIFVNGDNNLENLRTNEDTWKVNLIEFEMKKRMFE